MTDWGVLVGVAIWYAQEGKHYRLAVRCLVAVAIARVLGWHPRARIKAN